MLMTILFILSTIQISAADVKNEIYLHFNFKPVTIINQCPHTIAINFSTQFHRNAPSDVEERIRSIYPDSSNNIITKTEFWVSSYETRAIHFAEIAYRYNNTDPRSILANTTSVTIKNAFEISNAASAPNISGLRTNNLGQAMVPNAIEVNYENGTLQAKAKYN